MEDVVGFFPDDRFVVRFRHLHENAIAPRARPAPPYRGAASPWVTSSTDGRVRRRLHKGRDVLPPHARARGRPQHQRRRRPPRPTTPVATLPADVLADVVPHHLLQSDRVFQRGSRACRDAVRTARRLRAESKGAYPLSYLRTSRLSLTHFLTRLSVCVGPPRSRPRRADAQPRVRAGGAPRPPRDARVPARRSGRSGADVRAAAARYGHVTVPVRASERVRVEPMDQCCPAGGGHVDCLARENGARDCPRRAAARGTRGLRDVRAEERVHFRRGSNATTANRFFDEAARSTMVQEV